MIIGRSLNHKMGFCFRNIVWVIENFFEAYFVDWNQVIWSLNQAYFKFLSDLKHESVLVEA